MTKEKVMAFMPGDEVLIKTSLKCDKYTIVRIQAITLDEPVSDVVNVDFED